MLVVPRFRNMKKSKPTRSFISVPPIKIEIPKFYRTVSSTISLAHFPITLKYEYNVTDTLVPELETCEKLFIGISFQELCQICHIRETSVPYTANPT